ncbi:S9 family peptidase [Phocaeicola coprocola]|uniref:S9 family peptidase n=1 Tax=Phocaeicola coprocola TaxID=310298 RepID=UPI001C3919A6|nr:DPP IV N-terminal domain-containing protein [Phocaeicola coprocola]MBV3865710.1 S9 family peptidase [Phocaeicola coprocola]MBV4008655.1 S9 family peptidase [Phocaeicola coprocola]MBV4031316.1 S9 family peptidase [Phocaeicola coprocola]MBV4037925.1 S9 family peptidase [Phocaeicola coprocola]MBV4059542.1 S9 family peptidase [Phocaeicola coprocola]
MKRIFQIIALFCMIATISSAQEKKTFTLNDVIPGGDNYFNLVPKSMPGLQWWGDICVRTDIENIKKIDTKSGKESILVTLEEVNEALKNGEMPYKLTGHIKPLRTLMAASLPWGDRNVITFTQYDDRTPGQKYMIWYDFSKKKIVNLFNLQGEGPTNFDFCKENGYMAYTIGNDLYVAHEGDFSSMVNPKVTGNQQQEKDVVYGQAVHRNEFGIMKGTFWSPKGTYLAFYRMDQSMVTDYPQVNTTARIAELVPDKYPMAGMTSHKVTVGIYNVKDGKTIYLQAGDPTDRYFTNISWGPDEKSVFVIELNRDQNHAQLVQYDAVSGQKIGVLYEEKHARYVEPQHPLIFLPWDDSQFIYQTQRNGFNHLFLMDTKTKLKGEWKTGKDSEDQYCEYLKAIPLTEGNWLVQDVLGFNTSRKEIIIASTEISPLQTNIFSLNVKNGKRTLIGMEDGTHQAKLSASGTYLIDYFTSNNVPREISILPTTGKKGTTLFTATDPLKENYNLPEITVGTIKAADGETDLYYRLIKPVNFDPNKKYPAIIYVYGGPHAQMIHNTRFYDARGWDLYMAQQGYVMLTVDNRGSDNRGIKFENCTFRHLGTEEMKDQVQGAKFLQSLPYVDADKIGVHGWSFGGFMTTNLMLTYPDIFKVGVAGGPVIDWQFYEVMYGERYMDTPQANPEGYKESNLRLKAGNLKGRLEVIIGGMDPTCVPQHSISFLRACIDAGTHPDFFIYPEDGHNMMGRDRVHLHEHITRYFLDHLK